MASIDSISQLATTSAASTAKPSAATSSAQTEQNQFLKLLVAQLQGQNPLDPMDGTQFVSQLAQFSSLQELTGVHTDLDNINAYFQNAAAQNAAAAQSAAASQTAAQTTASAAPQTIFS